MMFTLRELINITDGEPVFFKDGLKARGVSTDSRTIRKGELFVALKGERFNGHNFVKQARIRGAAAAVVSEGLKGLAGFPLIRVSDTVTALGSIARAHRERFNIPLIAVTGSNGKTTTKDMLAHILSRKFKVLKTDENENNKIGVARTLLRLKDHDVAVLEIGTSFCGEIKYHCSVLRPDIAVITNIGPSHLKGLVDARGVLKEKIALVGSLGRGGIWVKNFDDRLLSPKNPGGIKILTYGIKNRYADFKAFDIRQTNSGIEFKLGTAPMRNNAGLAALPKFSMPVFGTHNVYNALAAIATCSIFMDIESIREALSGFKAPKMRTQILNRDGFTIIDDSYNSNPASFKYAVSLLKEYPVSGRRIAVCADMLELGESSQSWHYNSGEMLAEEGIDLLITYGRRSRHIARGAIDNGMDRDKVAIFRDKGKIAPFLRRVINGGDIVLIKGSRAMRMEEIVNCFTTCSIR